MSIWPRKGSTEPVFVAYILFFVPFSGKTCTASRSDSRKKGDVPLEGKGEIVRLSTHSGLRQNIYCAADV